MQFIRLLLKQDLCVCYQWKASPLIFIQTSDCLSVKLGPNWRSFHAAEPNADFSRKRAGERRKESASLKRKDAAAAGCPKPQGDEWGGNRASAGMKMKIKSSTEESGASMQDARDAKHGVNDWNTKTVTSANRLEFISWFLLYITLFKERNLLTT